MVRERRAPSSRAIPTGWPGIAFEAGLRIDSVSALSFEFSVIELSIANQSISAPPGS